MAAQRARDARDARETHHARDVRERGVAAEELVAAHAGEGHLDARLVHGLADEPRVDAVDGRLVHAFEDARQIGGELVARDGTRVVCCAPSSRAKRSASGASLNSGERQRERVQRRRFARRSARSPTSRCRRRETRPPARR
jgi:hypothetical protein